MAEETSHYTVLARRFRPQTFDEVVGQRHVAQSLRNAIRVGRVAHAYLFTGARGVGKTSMARILAKALNCPNAQDAVPCNKCEICLGIAAGSDVDIHEIDGASNRGIDDIRSLRANVNVKSMRTKFKMYIIDEVHMLSRDAFNALLKTLEEPPANVKFVFCTTEPTKVPDTILSRCQRFDFSTIETQSIVTRLHEIAVIEGYEVDQAALELVARRAAGSMRDSQSLFDQLLSFGEEHITAEDVHRLLGTASDERMMALVEALIQRQNAQALIEFDAALASGVQLGELVDQLINYLRDLMILAGGAQGVELLAVSPDNREKLANQATRWGLQTIVAAMQIIADTKSRMFRVPFARALAELGLLRISMLDDLQAIGDLIHELKSGNAISVSATQSSRPAPAVPPAASRPAAVPAPAPPQSADTTVKKNAPEPRLNGDHRNGDHLATAEVSVTPTVPFEAGRKDEFWTQVLASFDEKLRVYLHGVSSVAISGPNHLELTFPRSYNLSKRYWDDRPESLRKLEELASRVAGQPVRITFRLADTAVETEPQEVAKPKDNKGLRRELETDDPYVQQAKTIFEATILKVEPIASSAAEQE